MTIHVMKSGDREKKIEFAPHPVAPPQFLSHLDFLREQEESAMGVLDIGALTRKPSTATAEGMDRVIAAAVVNRMAGEIEKMMEALAFRWLTYALDASKYLCLNKIEREDARLRLQQYRREELYRNLRSFGIEIDVAEHISEAVWEVETPWSEKQCHRSINFGIVGFKG